MIYNSRTDTDVCQDIIFIFCIFFICIVKKVEERLNTTKQWKEVKWTDDVLSDLGFSK